MTDGVAEPSLRRMWVALLAAPLVLFAAFAPVVAWLSSQGRLGDDPVKAMEPIAAGPSVVGFGALFLLVRTLARRDGLSLRDLGWTRPSALDVGVGLGVGLGFFALEHLALHPWLIGLRPSFDPTLASTPLPLVLLMLPVAMVAEDTLYRGYAFVRLRERHGVVVAGAVTTVGYALLAPGQGWPLTVFTLGLGVVLFAVRLWRGGLVPVLLVHLVAGVGPVLLGRLR